MSSSTRKSQNFIKEMLGGPYGTFESFLLFTGVKFHDWQCECDPEWELDKSLLFIYYDHYHVVVVLECDYAIQSRRLEITFRMGGYQRTSGCTFFGPGGANFRAFRDLFIDITSLDPYPFQTL